MNNVTYTKSIEVEQAEYHRERRDMTDEDMALEYMNPTPELIAEARTQDSMQRNYWTREAVERAVQNLLRKASTASVPLDNVRIEVSVSDLVATATLTA